jgi:predicted dehydrogenase
VDYAAQEVEAYRLVPREGRMPGIEGGKLTVERYEPLRRELEDFIGAVREARPPLVTGRQGRAALVLAQRVVERMETSN